MGLTQCGGVRSSAGCCRYNAGIIGWRNTGTIEVSTFFFFWEMFADCDRAPEPNVVRISFAYRHYIERYCSTFLGGNVLLTVAGLLN